MINKKKYTIVTNDFINTGGHCMVTVITIYDKLANKTLFMSVSEEYSVLSTVDHINIDVDELIDTNDYIIRSIRSERLTCLPTAEVKQLIDIDEDLFMLFKYCQFEDIKSRCQHSGNHHFIDVDQVPVDMFSELTLEYNDWLIANSQLLETDGKQIYIDSRYTPTDMKVEPVEADTELSLLDAFIAYVETECGRPDKTADEMQVVITVGRRTLVTYDQAALMQGLLDALYYFQSEQ